MAPLRALLQTAVEEGALRANPAAAMRLPAPKRSPQRKHLEPDELARLHEAVPEDWRSFVRLLAYTGARIGEFVELRWADLDLEEGPSRSPAAATGARWTPPRAPTGSGGSRSHGTWFSTSGSTA
jgi:integrase